MTVPNILGNIGEYIPLGSISGQAADVVILLLVLLRLAPGDVVRKAITIEGNPGENTPGRNCFTVP